MTIGQKIKKARKKIKLTQKELAEITGISIPAIVSYELDRHEPCISYAVRIADALGISLDYLARADK